MECEKSSCLCFQRISDPQGIERTKKQYVEVIETKCFPNKKSVLNLSTHAAMKTEIQKDGQL